VSQELHSVEQVAERLGLHVRTVRAYIREGRLEASRVGKQYRITEAAVRALLGPSAAPPPAPTADASCVVELEGLDRASAERLTTLVMASVSRRPGAHTPLRVQAVHDEPRERLKFLIVGGLRDTADLLLMLDAWEASAR